MRGFFGWTVVGAAFVVAVFGWGVGFYGPPIYLQAVRDTRGWSVGLVSAAMTVHFLVGAIAVANLPRLHRRLGVATTTVAGAASLGLDVAGWAFAAEPWQLFAAALASGSGWVALGAAGINAIVSPWFNRRRPAALSTAYNGASIGGVIFSPLWVARVMAWDAVYQRGNGATRQRVPSGGLLLPNVILVLGTRLTRDIVLALIPVTSTGINAR